MTVDNILESVNKIEEIRSSFIQPKKIQLHTGLDGFESPLAYGVYKHTGGNALGIVGKDYFPIDLNLFLDTIVNSLTEAGGFNLDTLAYNEYKAGRKIAISVKSDDFEVNSPVIGDVFKTELLFTSGFDGFTKTAITFRILRLFCMNGAKSWKPELSLSFKNTLGNQGKIGLFTKEISKIKFDIEDYKKDLDRIANIPVTKKEVNDFFYEMFGYSENEYKELTKRSTNILDNINKCIAIESATLGLTKYSLLQAATRYATHVIGSGPDSVLFDSNATFVKNAHTYLLN